MRSPLFLSLLTSASLSSLAVGQTITSCPTAEISITALDGSVFSVCPNADYQGPSIKTVNAVKRRDDCVQLCQQYSGCQRAVFDKTQWLCHIKDNPDTLTWAVNPQYETIRFTSKLAKGEIIKSCPTGEYNVTAQDRSSWAVCPNSDFQGTTLQATYQISSETACAQLCSTTNGCVRSVYQAKELACHLKDGTNSDWTFNNDYETIRLLSRPQVGDVLTSCPGGDQNVTSSKGLGFAICSSSDFGGAATQIIDNVGSNFDCMLSCDSADACTKAVYDPASKVCFLKANDAPWTFDPQYQSIRLVNKTSSFVGNAGKWSQPVNFPVVFAGAFIAPEQPYSYRVLGYSSWGTYEFSGPTGITQFGDYNWKTGAVSQRTVTETKHDMFCPGMSFLANGTMVVTGGENAEAVSFYNFQTNKWTRAADMKVARGYQSSTTLSNGNIFTIGGSFTGGIGGTDVAVKNGEVYNPNTGAWTLLSGTDVRPMLTTYDAEGPWRTDNHAWLFGWKNGYVFQAGPSKTMHWYGTNGGTGSVSAAGTRDTANDAMCGVSVMFDAVAGKILTAGGSQSYTNSPAFRRAHLITIGEPQKPAGVEQLPDMTFSRGFANVVVLPNGQVLVSGGQATSLVFTDVQSALAPELWDPVTKKFTVLAPAKIPRNYHSVSLLLADGTVFTAGGGLCPVGQGESTAFCDQAINHFNGEIFSPPYLFKTDGTAAPRPSITALSSDIAANGFSVRVGGKLTVTMNDASGATFSLVRIGSSTHSVNTDQRRVPLSQVAANGAKYTITLPNDAGIVLPGHYYLFAMNKAGTPAIARTVRVML
ncbi:Hypothetical protein D9617_24g017410 [Elsinoe fawcettii]|nr:Hypothetical protein D9617_24g017410 [Elsinoe fawcettii]